MENKNIFSITRIDNDKYQLSVFDDDEETSIDINHKEAVELAVLIGCYIAKIQNK